MKDRRVRDRRVRDGRVARKMCKQCGKMLPEQEMFKKIRVTKNMSYYICCKICDEQFSGKLHSGVRGIKFK